MRLFNQSLVVAALVCGPSSAAQAAIIYSKLGPGDSFSTNFSYSIGPQAVASQFTPTVTSTFQDTLVTVGDLRSAPGSTLIVSLEADAGGSPGAILEQITVSGLSVHLI